MSHILTRGRSRSRDRANTHSSRDLQVQQVREERAAHLRVPHRGGAGGRRQVSPGLAENRSRPKRSLSNDSPEDRDGKWTRLEEDEDEDEEY